MNNKILYVDLGLKRLPPGHVFVDKICSFGDKVTGHIVAPSDAKNVLEMKKLGSFFLHTYRPFPFKFPGVILVHCIYLFIYSLAVLLNDKTTKVIVARTPLYTGLIAVILGKLLKRHSLIEVNGDFNVAFRYERPSGPTKTEVLKDAISRIIVRFSLGSASAIKLLYPTQIDCFQIKNIHKKAVHSFHDYVRISRITNFSPSKGKYILTLGYPWYLKGVDVLIKAFKRLSPEFPEYKLKVHGWCPEEKEFFLQLADGCDQIELNDPVYHSEALSLILNCDIFVLASRTEGMGRVLLEAMAAHKPIVASNVSGIPAVVKDGFNGLLFTSENYIDLYNKIREVLGDKSLSDRLADNGYSYVQEHLSEEMYTEKYQKMVSSLYSV